MNVLKNTYWFAYVMLLIVSCNPEKEEETCGCCDVKVAQIRFDSLLSLHEDVSGYNEIFNDSAIKIVRSEWEGGVEGADIWHNDYWYSAAYPSKPQCASVKFELKEIYYEYNFGLLVAGFKEAKSAYEKSNENSDYSYFNEKKVSEKFDTNTVFMRYYNTLLSWNKDAYDIIYNEKKPLIKNNFYGDFKYTGAVAWHINVDVNIKINSTFKYNNVFVAETRGGKDDTPKLIYIDRDYGLVRLVMNNGNVWTYIHWQQAQ